MKLDVVIPVAGPGRRMRVVGPKCLVKVGGECLLRRQVRLLRLSYPQARFVVVAGCQADKVRKAVAGQHVKVVDNPDYETTNVAYSIALGLTSTRPDASVLVVYGDLVFSPGFASGLDYDSSAVLTESRHSGDGVGVTSQDGETINLSYGLPTSWARSFLLNINDKHVFAELALRPQLSRHLTHEILNVIIESGVRFLSVPTSGLVTSIDSPRDLARLPVLAD